MSNKHTSYKTGLDGIGPIARGIALPGESKPQRYPSFPALERTAVMGFNAPLSYAPKCATPFKVMLCRQAAYPLWATQAFTGCFSYSASWKCDLGSSSGNQESTVSPGPIAYTSGTVPHLLAGSKYFPRNDATTALPARGPFLGTDLASGPLEWIYAPIGSLACISINFENPPDFNDDVQMVVESWSSTGQFSSNSIKVDAPVGGGGCVIASLLGYGSFLRVSRFTLLSNLNSDYMPTINIMVTNATVATFTQDPAPGNFGKWALSVPTPLVFLPLSYPAEFDHSELPWQGTRVTAVSALFTNVSQLLNKDGTVLWGRVSPTSTNPFLVVESDITNLHPAEKAFLALEQGTYTYVAPSTDMADFWDYTVNSTNLLASYPDAKIQPLPPLYRLDNTSLVNIAFFSDPSATTALAVNLDWHIEFRTTSALFQVGLSTVTLEAFHQAQLLLANHSYFYNNSNHVALLRRITQIVRTVLRTPLVRSYLGNPIVEAITSRPKRISNRTKVSVPKPAAHKPPATSAQGSGIVKKKASGLEMYFQQNPTKRPSSGRRR